MIGIIRMNSLLQTKASKAKPPGKYDWFKKLYNADDNYIKKTCGTDVALYLVY